MTLATFNGTCENEALELLGDGRLHIVPQSTRAPGRGEVEIATAFSYVSAGTELASIHSRRERYLPGTPPRPLGYSISGIVRRVGEGVNGLREGERVVAIGAGAHHARRNLVAHNLVVPLPEAVSLKGAALMAMYCFALEGVAKAAPRMGEQAVVFGAGMMGQITARLFHLCGALTHLLDPHPARLERLPKGIATYRLDETGWGELHAATREPGIEIASICFGGDATESVRRLRPMMLCYPDGVPHGRIIFPGGATVQLEMASGMGNLQFHSSSKAGAGYRDPAWEYGEGSRLAYHPFHVRRNMETILRLLADGRLENPERLITHTIPLREAPEVYQQLAGNPAMLGVVLEA